MGRIRYRRGVYLLPTLFTVGNLFCGFASLVFAASGRVEGRERRAGTADWR